MKDIIIVTIVILIFSMAILSAAYIVSARADKAKNLLQFADESLKARDYDKAIEYFQKAISLGAKNPVAYAGLGNSYLQKYNSDKAIGYFQEALSLDAKNPFAYVGLGIAYARANNPEEAIEYFQKAISLGAKNPVAHYGLGAAYLSLNQKDLALQQMKILEKLNKDLATGLRKQMQ